MNKRISDLEARENARAALDPFGLVAEHDPDQLAAQALDLWETEALLVLSDADIPELPGHSNGNGPVLIQPQPAPPPQQQFTVVGWQSVAAERRRSHPPQHVQLSDRRRVGG